MIKKCEIHQKYDEIFICIHKTMLKKEGNKFSCHKCVTSGLNTVEQKESVKNMEELEEEAKENLAKFVEMQNKIINSNNEIKQKYLQSLTELQDKLNQYLQKQQKPITDIIEQYNQILTQNINQANQLLNQQSVLDIKSIDNFIIFALLNNTNQQFIENKYAYINKCLDRQFNYEFAEFQCKVNQFTSMEIKFDNVPKYETEKFQIETELDIQLTYCDVHKGLKEWICIHEDCIKEQKEEYLCLKCPLNNHDKHSKGDFIQAINKIKTDQIQKLKIIEEQYEQLELEVEKSVDKELTMNQQKQQEIFDANLTIRQNLKGLEAQTKVNPFNQIRKYIYPNIDQNLLLYDEKVIKQEFQSKLDLLEQKKKNITKTQLEFNKQCKIIEEQSQAYYQENSTLQKKVQEQENQISQLQKKLQTNQKEPQLSEVQKQLNRLIEQSNQQNQIIHGIDEIKLYSQKILQQNSTQTPNVESQQSQQSQLSQLSTTQKQMTSNNLNKRQY